MTVTIESNAIIEAAVTALLDSQGLTVLGRANAVLAAVTPLIRATALEEAAQVADKVWGDAYELRIEWFTDQIAAAIRSLKEQP